MKNSTKFIVLSFALLGGMHVNAAVNVLETIPLTFENEVVASAYDEGQCSFDATNVLEKLGCSNLMEAEVVSLTDEDEVITDKTQSERGYFYNFDGQVCQWGTDQTAWYVMNDGNNYFIIANMLGVDQTDGTCNIGFLYNGNAVMFDITVKLSPKELGTVNVVSEIGLIVKQEPSKEDYLPTVWTFNVSDVLSALGCSSINAAQVYSIDADNNVLAQTGNNGYWYTADGEVCGWGESAAWFIEFNGSDGWNIGNYPGIEEAKGTCNIGFMYDDKFVKFNVSVEIAPKEIVKTNVLQTYDLTFSNEVERDYEMGPLTFDAEAVKRLLGCDELTTDMLITIEPDENVISELTATNGFWYNADGEVCEYGNGSVWCIEYTAGTDFMVGNMAGIYAAEGACNIGFQYEGNAVMFNVDVNITEKEVVREKVNVVTTYSLKFSNKVTEDYQTATCGFNYSEVLSKLGCSTLTTDMLISLDSDGYSITKKTANSGFWYNAEGEVCTWGEDAVWFIEYLNNTSEFIIGNMEKVLEAKGNCNIGFQNEGNAVMFDVRVVFGEDDEEDNNDGVESLSSDACDVLKVYNLQGVKVNVKDVNELGSGLYIINGKKVLVNK